MRTPEKNAAIRVAVEALTAMLTGEGQADQTAFFVERVTAGHLADDEYMSDLMAGLASVSMELLFEREARTGPSPFATLQQIALDAQDG